MADLDLALTGLTQQEILDALVNVSPVCYGGYSFDPGEGPHLALTATNQVVTGWTPDTELLGVSESNGEFTLATAAKFSGAMSRVYHNHDTNPQDIVHLTITIEASTDGGTTWITAFTASSDISAATSNQEPAVVSFSDPFLPTIEAGTRLRVLAKAEDGAGVDPSECDLARVKVSIHAFAPYPVV